MAVSSIKFKIDVDTKQVSSALKSAQSSMQATANTAKGSTGVFSSIGNSLKSIGSAALSAVSRVGKMAMAITVFKGVNAAVNMVTGSVGSAISRIDTLNNSNRVFANMGFSAKETKATMDNLNKSIQGLPTPLDSAVQGVQLLAGSTGNLSKSQEVFSALNNGIIGFGGSTEMVQNALIQLSQSFSNGKVDAQTWNSLIQSGLGPALNALAKQMGMTTGQLKAGLSDGSISIDKFQDALISLNKNGGGGLASLEKIARDATSGIKTSLENMKTAVTRGVATVIQGIDGLSEKLTGKGISAWIQEIGIQFENGLNKMAGSVGKLEGPLKAAFPTMKKVFESLKEIATTTGDSLLDGFSKIGSQVGPIFGQLADLIINNMGTIESIISAVVEVVTGVILGIGDAIQIAIPYFEALVKGIGSVVDGIKSMLPEGTSLTDVVRDLTPKIIAAVAGFKLLKGGVSIAFGAFQKFNGVLDGIGKFKTFASAVKGGARAFEKLSPAAKIAVKVFQTLGGAVTKLAGVFATAFKAIGAAAMAHPVIAAVVAIIAIIVLLWTKCEWFRDGVKAVWDAIKNIWQASIEAIGNFMTGLGEKISSAWETIKLIFTVTCAVIWALIVKTFNDMVSFITGVISGIGNAISTGLLVIQIGWQVMWTAISTFFSTIWEGIKTVCSVAINAVSTGISVAWNAIKTVTVAIWTGIQAFFSAVWSGIQAIFAVVVAVIISVVSNAWNTIKAVSSAIWNGIKAVISAVVNGIKAVITAIFNAIKSFISNVWNGIKTVTVSVWNGIKSAISSAINGAKSIVSSVVNGIKSTVSNVFNGIKSIATSVWNGIKSAITRPIEAAKNTVLNIVERIKSAFNFRIKFPPISIPHIPLPHFSISGSFNPLKGKIPSIGIDWYATGGIFTGPSVVGVGEAGDEAVVPLSNKSRMAPFAKAVSDFMKDEQQQQPIYESRLPQRVTIEIPFIVNGKQFAKATVKDLQTELDKADSSKNRRRGKKN